MVKKKTKVKTIYEFSRKDLVNDFNHATHNLHSFCSRFSDLVNQAEDLKDCIEAGDNRKALVQEFEDVYARLDEQLRNCSEYLGDFGCALDKLTATKI